MVEQTHVRTIAVNYYDTNGGGGNVALGLAVPTVLRTRRFIYYLKISHDSAAPQLFHLYRDGIVGAVPLDDLYLAGFGGGGLAENGSSAFEMCINIESPFYILESGQQFGFSSPGGVNAYCLITCYDEP